MKKTSKTSIEGRFLHRIYSPHGTIEGVLIEAQGAPVQFVFEHDDEVAPAAFQGLAPKQVVVVEGEPQGPSDKGDPEHPVYAFSRLIAVDGAAPEARHAAPEGPAYWGKVVRFNHARHGERNGVVLDSGDFIHTRPEGMAKLKLKPGDTVEADGDAQRLADDSGWAVEATVVNGLVIEPH